MLTLVKKAMRGNKESFLKLIDMHMDSMLRIAHNYLSQQADVADAIQDTILDAYEHLSSLKEPRYFKTWLIRILLNNCNHIYHKNRKFISLDAVSEENRLCFQLYYGEELTTREIAEILHINENTIRSRMQREILHNSGGRSYSLFNRR